MAFRSKRKSRIKNYAPFENGSSDEDFVCSPVPTKKKISRRVDNTMVMNKKNGSCTSNKSSANISSQRRNPKERLSADEMKFEEDLKIALALSAERLVEFTEDQSTEVKELTSNSHSKKMSIKNENGSSPIKEIDSNSSANPKDNFPLDSNKDSLYASSVLSPKISCTESDNSVSTNRRTRRTKKQVSFSGVSGESDESSDQDQIASDDSDVYKFSPVKKKKKKANKLSKTSPLNTNQKTKICQFPRVCITDIQKKQKSDCVTIDASKTDHQSSISASITAVNDDILKTLDHQSIITPVNAAKMAVNDGTSNILDHQSSISTSITEVNDDISKILGHQSSITSVNTAQVVVNNDLSKTLDHQSKFSAINETGVAVNSATSKTSRHQSSITSISTNEKAPLERVSDSSCKLGVIKTPFKSPTLSTTSPKFVSSSQSSKTGLRIGLSRKLVTKSLHPNIATK